jgi:hypothetical protein
MTKVFALLLFSATWPAAPLCAQSFSSGKNLHELRRAVYAGTLPKNRDRLFRPDLPQRLPEQSSGVQGLPHTFLPKWTPDAQPFFCKIEHRMGRRMAVPLKFRLGSVEYVDRLEYPGRWGVD